MRQNLANVFFTLYVGRLVAPPLADSFSPVYGLLRSLGLENRATIVAQLSKLSERRRCKPMA